ncbi:MAG: hypothetical protein ACOX0A_02950 [Thermoguttaceae bacterium]
MYWQTTSRAASSESARISQKVRYDVSLECRERLQPGVERFINVEIQSQESDEPILFCPEIYKLRLNDFKLLHALAASFDNRGRSPESDALLEPSAVNEVDQGHEADQIASFADIVYESADRFKGYTLLVLPRAYYRSSQTSEIVGALGDRLLRAIGVDANSNASSALCLVVVETFLTSEEEFDEIRNAPNETTNEKWTRRELLGAFRTAVYQTPRGNAGINEETTQNETLVFSSETPVFEKFRALFYNSEKIARTDALFELRKVSSPVPFYASLLRDKLDGTLRVEYDSSYGATPGSLASQFVPFLSFLDRRGWISGRTVYRSNSWETPNFWSVELVDFHLYSFELSELCKRFRLPAFSGIISDLSIDAGQICCGVFRGDGSIKIRNGAIPVKVVKRLNAMDMLETSPRSAMQLRFINDATPFNELELQFSLNENGIVFDSHYRNKIIAYYEKGPVKYGLFLTESTAGKETPYAAPLTALFESRDSRSFWNPLVRKAINHLPVPETAEIDSNSQMLR